VENHSKRTRNCRLASNTRALIRASGGIGRRASIPRRRRVRRAPPHPEITRGSPSSSATTASSTVQFAGQSTPTRRGSQSRPAPIRPRRSYCGRTNLRWVAVRHHFRERPAIHHRPQFAAIVIPHGIEHHSLAWIERVAEAPLLPAHFAIVDLGNPDRSAASPRAAPGGRSARGLRSAFSRETGAARSISGSRGSGDGQIHVRHHTFPQDAH